MRKGKFKKNGDKRVARSASNDYLSIVSPGRT